MQTIVFVGVHHKTDKAGKMLPALCSTTYTGKVIDEIIEKLPEYECLRMNVFPTTTMPDYEQRAYYIDSFPIDENYLYVLLGKVVKDSIAGIFEAGNVIAIDHPGRLVYGGNRVEYVANAVKAIENALMLHQWECPVCGSHQMDKVWRQESICINDHQAFLKFDGEKFLVIEDKEKV